MVNARTVTEETREPNNNTKFFKYCRVNIPPRTGVCVNNSTDSLTDRTPMNETFHQNMRIVGRRQNERRSAARGVAQQVTIYGGLDGSRPSYIWPFSRRLRRKKSARERSNPTVVVSQWYLLTALSSQPSGTTPRRESRNRSPQTSQY